MVVFVDGNQYSLALVTNIWVFQIIDLKKSFLSFIKHYSTRDKPDCLKGNITVKYVEILPKKKFCAVFNYGKSSVDSWKYQFLISV